MANLAACLKFPTSHLQEHMANLKPALMYSSAFFISSNFEALL
jgi:hypothetical protein